MIQAFFVWKNGKKLGIVKILRFIGQVLKTICHPLHKHIIIHWWKKKKNHHQMAPQTTLPWSKLPYQLKLFLLFFQYIMQKGALSMRNLDQPQQRDNQRGSVSISIQIIMVYGFFARMQYHKNKQRLLIVMQMRALTPMQESNEMSSTCRVHECIQNEMNIC